MFPKLNWTAPKVSSRIINHLRRIRAHSYDIRTLLSSSRKLPMDRYTVLPQRMSIS